MPVGSIGQIQLPPSPDLFANRSADNGGFGALLKDAMSNVTQTDAASKAAGLEAILGGDIDLHNVTIAASKAELMLSMTLAIRSKIIDAYQEMMRMSI